MSLSGAVNAAIKVAKAKLGDLVQAGTYRKFREKVYVAGVYTNLYDDIPVEYAPDRFSYEEMRDEDYQLSDVKILVFNTDNVVDLPSTQDAFVKDGIQYNVKRIGVTQIGNFRPVLTIVLRR